MKEIVKRVFKKAFALGDDMSQFEISLVLLKCNI